MSDLIKREDAMAIAFKSPFFSNALMEEFKTIPTIDAVSVVHGEWIKHKEKTEINGKFIDFFPAEYECSNCGLREAHYFINPKPHNFCPNCGAKMDGERKESE